MEVKQLKPLINYGDIGSIFYYCTLLWLKAIIPIWVCNLTYRLNDSFSTILFRSKLTIDIGKKILYSLPVII